MGRMSRAAAGHLEMWGVEKPPQGQFQWEEGREVFFLSPKRFLRGKFIYCPDVYTSQSWWFCCSWWCKRVFILYLVQPSWLLRTRFMASWQDCHLKSRPWSHPRAELEGCRRLFHSHLQVSRAGADHSDGVLERSWAVAGLCNPPVPPAPLPQGQRQLKTAWKLMSRSTTTC